VLAGRVVDAAGEPVAGAVVVVRPHTPGATPVRSTPGRIVPVRTNDEGRFFFTDLPAGNYQLNVSKPGWLPGAYGRVRPDGAFLPIVLADAQRRTDLAVTLWRPAVITGTVSDDNQEPLIGVEVRAIRLMHIAGRRQMVIPQRPETLARQITDDRGVYRFSELTPGDYLIAVLTSVLSEPPTFAGAIRAAGETPSSYYQTMTAVGTAPIVFDRATGVAGGGRGLVGSLSNVSGVPATDGPWATYPTTYHPASTTQSGATVIRAVSGEEHAPIDVHVRLVNAWQVSGVLSGPEGPAPWHAVHLVAADTGDVPLVDVGTAVTDAAGAFTFYGVPPGQYIARVVVTPRPPGNLRLGQAGGTGAIPYITAFSGGPGSSVMPLQTDPLLHVSVPLTVSDRPVRGLTLTMSEGPRVRGRIVFEGAAPQLTPEQLQQIAVMPVAANGRENSSVFPGRASADLQFTTPSLWPGRYLLRATAPGGWTLHRAMYQGRDISADALDVNADIDNVVMTFTDKTTKLKGTVQVDSGMSVSDAVVLLFPTEQTSWVDYGKDSRRVVSARASENGAYTLDAPPEGDYFVVAISDADASDWQNPATLTKLASLAERLTVRGAEPPPLALRLRRVR
jgi:protocatechuate 3,4-dioxygenase beta subunit